MPRRSNPIPKFTGAASGKVEPPPYTIERLVEYLTMNAEDARRERAKLMAMFAEPITPYDKTLELFQDQTCADQWMSRIQWKASALAEAAGKASIADRVLHALTREDTDDLTITDTSPRGRLEWMRAAFREELNDICSYGRIRSRSTSPYSNALEEDALAGKMEAMQRFVNAVDRGLSKLDRRADEAVAGIDSAVRQ